MKNKLILSTILMLGLVCPSFANEGFDAPPPPPGREQNFNNQNHKRPEFNKEEMEKKKADFEARLQLTDAQKAKAKEIREKSQKEMKPVMDAIKAKRDELKAAKTTGAAKEELQKIQSDLQVLDKKAHQLREDNMKQFEKILNSKQLKELEKMKEEGRKKFEEAHKKGKRPADGINPPPAPPKEIK